MLHETNAVFAHCDNLIVLALPMITVTHRQLRYAARHAPMLKPETETDQEADDLGIEDAVIRELARALQPLWGR